MGKKDEEAIEVGKKKWRKGETLEVSKHGFLFHVFFFQYCSVLLTDFFTLEL